MEYIIDFDRLNELSVINMDTFVGNTISRRILKNYLEIYERKEHKDRDSVIKTLVYNRILIGEDTIRDQKIDEILETNEDRNSLING